MNALRSKLSAIARRRSGLSKGGPARFRIRLRAALSGTSSQIASDAWLLTSFNRGGCKEIMSNFPAMKPNILVDVFGMIVYSIPSRYGRSFFQ